VPQVSIDIKAKLNSVIQAIKNRDGVALEALKKAQEKSKK